MQMSKNDYKYKDIVTHQKFQQQKDYVATWKIQ